MDVSFDPRLRSLPSVDRVLAALEGAGRLNGIPRPLAAHYVRAVIDDLRRRLLDGSLPEAWEPDGVITLAAEVLARRAGASLRRAINATGIVIHTNLGRAPLSAAAQAAVAGVLEGYSLLEMDPETGERGSRQEHVRALLRAATGAEAALAVNNNAAAVLLGLAAMAGGRDVVLSRGELVEIGGAFRMPDVMTQSGARLVEIGTTNRTYLADYERALTPQTALLLKVHRSNFALTGFVHEVEARDLARLGALRGIPVMYDLGSGALVDLAARGLPAEPTVQDTVAAGVDLITFSGDKVLGGPQAGLLVGTAAAIARCRVHPLARAMRIDRLSLAALAATLRHYLTPEEPWREIPVLRMLAADQAGLRETALRLATHVREVLGARADVDVVDTQAQAGGGALPGASLPSAAVAVRPKQASVEEWSRRLRQHDPPVIARIHEDALLLDLRTILPGELESVIDAFRF